MTTYTDEAVRKLINGDRWRGNYVRAYRFFRATCNKPLADAIVRLYGVK